MKRPFFLLAFAAFLIGGAAEAYGQCDVGVYLIRTEKASSNGDDGKILVEVKATGSFECVLRAVSGEAITEIEKKSGNGRSNVEFDQLSAGKFYEILVVYHDEQELLCKKRVLSDVIIEVE